MSSQNEQPLVPSAPSSASVTGTSSQILAANSNRRGLLLVNTSGDTISLGLDANAAVLNSGITLLANGGTWVMDDDSFTEGAVSAISSGTSSNLAIQEFV